MTGELPLRPYQAEDLDKIELEWARGTRRPALVWATGLGKTVLMARAAARFHRRTRRRVVLLAHRTELIFQASRKLHDAAPDLRIGIVKAELNQTLADIVVSSPQTLASPNRRRQLLNVGLVMADECHHYAAPSWHEVLQHFLDQDSETVALGVTATMSRGDSRSLGKVWDKIVNTRDIQFGITNGFLVRPVGRRVRVDDLDMRTVRRKGADYEADSLGDALTASMAPKRIAEALREHAPNGRHVIFAPTIAAAEVIEEATTAAGFRSATVHYRTPAARRRQILEEHADESSDLQTVCNRMVLTEGFDNPLIDTVVPAKTTHNGLYVQMVGRGLRPHFGKTSCLVLDVAGATEGNTLQAQIDLFGADDEPGTERDPCGCVAVQLATEPAACTCRRQGCTEACACGGGRRGRWKIPCGCTWPEVVQAERPDEVYADGRLITEAVDLFHASRIQWLTTAGGTHFLPAGDRYIAIVPGEVVHTWDVVAMHRYHRGGEHSRYIQRGVTDLGFAQAWAEADIRPDEQRIAGRAGGWRAKEPSKGTIDKARTLGIPVDQLMLAGLHAGELSNLITTAEATVRMDYTVAYLQRAQRHA